VMYLACKFVLRSRQQFLKFKRCDYRLDAMRQLYARL
jgi:hypothetical protein